MTDTILLTGISGFIAKHVAVKLLNAGYDVRGTVRRLDRAKEVQSAVAPHLTAGAGALSFVQADLESDAGWADAMVGVVAVVHTASPFPIAQPKDEQKLIRPAVEGTLRVLKAAQSAGVGRVVLTSSVVAVVNDAKPGVLQDESDWCDVSFPGTTAYSKSKTLAERAAWEFVSGTGIALTTINPGLVLGPPLDIHYGSSMQIVERLLKGRDPMVPDFGPPVVDVRDVAEMHLRAVQRPDTAGKRFIAVAGPLPFPEMARALKAAYPVRRIATRIAPTFVLRLLAVFDPVVRAILPKLGQVDRLANQRAVQEMGMEFIAPEEALLASADWLITHGRVKA